MTVNLLKESDIGVAQKRPDWFRQLWNAATTEFMFTSNEAPLETAIGAGRMIDDGEFADAKKICVQAGNEILTHHACPHIPGETKTTQIRTMITNGEYPRDLQDGARKLWNAKYPKDPIIST